MLLQHCRAGECEHDRSGHQHYNASGMLEHQFDQQIDRRHTNSAKWHQYPADVLPMWVADMDFAAPQPIVDALIERSRHGIFGYEFPTDSIREQISCWLLQRHGWDVSPEAILPLPGVVSSLALVTRLFCRPGDAAVTLTPAYPPFLSVPAGQGLSVISVPLAQSADGWRLRYEIDFDALQQALSEPRATMFIHCHPHNPTSREWSAAENQRIAQLCAEHDVLIVSDEIWADLTLAQHQHRPFALQCTEAADRCITLMAPSKTFNTPGLGFSFAVVTHPVLRRRLQAALFGNLPHINIFGLLAAQTAYSDPACAAWLDALRAYLTANRDFALAYVAQHLPALRATVPEATYLLWIDCSDAAVTRPFQFFLQQGKVALSDGVTFGPGYERFVRLNFGCPRAQLHEALERMRAALVSATVRG